MKIFRDRIPIGSLLTIKRDKLDMVLPTCPAIVYLGWDSKMGGMRFLFTDGTISTHDPEDVLNFFEYAPVYVERA